MESPEDLYYSPEHEWLRIDGQNVFIGLTGFAASALGDIIFVDIMGLGKLIPRGGVYGTVEAVKTVYDLIMPATGRLLEINPALSACPGLINQAPCGLGWIARIALNNGEELQGLMNGKEYGNGPDDSGVYSINRPMYDNLKP